MAEVAIVVVTYNSADWITRCLSSIPAALSGRQAEIVVVDNASTDDTVAAIRSGFPEVTLLVNDSNVGFAAAVNQGAANSAAPIVVLLNPDAELHAGALDELLTFAVNHPEHGVYGGRAEDPDGNMLPNSCLALPSLWSTLCFALGLSSALGRSRLFNPEAINGWQRDTVREVGVVVGCLLLTTRDIWEELHGLDERYFVYSEDVDFSARAAKRGYRPVIVPAAVITHGIGASSESSGTREVLILAGKITYIETQWTGWRRVIGRSLLRCGVALRAAIARATGRGSRWQYAWTARAQWQDGFLARDPRPRV